MRRRAPMIAAFDFVIILTLYFMIIALTESPTKLKVITIPTQGVYAVTQTCPSSNFDDVDLYVRDPRGDIAWFGALTAGLMHLEQDVIPGVNTQVDNIKILLGDDERVILRGVVPGEYVVDLNLYATRQAGPISCDVSLWDIRHNILVAQQKVTLHQAGDTLTAFRFVLDGGGAVTSINHDPLNIVQGVNLTPR